MASRPRNAILWMLCAALAGGIMVPLRASTTDLAMLKRIGSRVDDRAGVISIEASDPVPYVASQPDPKTFVVEMRDVLAVGFADDFTVDPRVPVSGVRVENTRAFDGAPIARVSLSLAQPMRPRVRSSRNVIYIETDRIDRVAAGVIGVIGPSAAIRDLQVAQRGAATAITLLATGRLLTTNVEESKDGPPRLYIDLANATSALPGLTPVGQGAVQNVRIGISDKSALLTRVAVELQRESTYHLEPSADGKALTVIVDDAAPASAQAKAAALMTQPSGLPAQQLPVAVMAQALPPPVFVPAVPAAAQQTPTAGATPPPNGLQTTGSQTTTLSGPTPPRYSGAPVSLDFQGADLRAVLRTFAEISGLNIVIDPTIQGTVDVSLRDVPWDQALDIILRANKLGYVLDGTIVRVAPLIVLADEETQRRKLAEEQALSGDLRVFTRTLSYANAKEMGPLLVATVLSQRGAIQTDVRTNTLIINDLPDRLQRASDLITTLDVPQRQVEIEARIIQTTTSFARQLGVQWGFNGRVAPSLGNTTPLAFPNNGSLGGAVLGAPSGTAVNLPATAATSAVALALGSVNGAFNLDVALSALEKSGQGRTLSTPRVSTQNNVTAEISQGLRIPIQTLANNTISTSFVDAKLKLTVTPQITAADTVIMKILVQNEAADFSLQVLGIPSINSQSATTEVLVSDGATTVIGGIYLSDSQTTNDRTPGLSRVPLLRWLFKHDGVSDGSRELLIFITPRILVL